MKSMKKRPKSTTHNRQDKLLFISIVVIGYIITFFFIFAQDGRRLTLEELFLGITFGVIYLYLGLNDSVIYDRLPVDWANVIFFSVQCFLILGIGLVLVAEVT